MDFFNVLIIDDEKDFVETMVNRLTKRKINTTGVFSGEEAIDVMKKKQFDLVILDIKMPGGMDGIETLKEIKKIQPLSEVILLTGHASVETSIEGMKLGAFDYVLKPITMEELLPKLEQAYERKAVQDEKIRRARVKEALRYS
ncbi:MAG: response regulator [Pseudomonadota bacterium]